MGVWSIPAASFLIHFLSKRPFILNIINHTKFLYIIQIFHTNKRTEERKAVLKKRFELFVPQDKDQVCIINLKVRDQESWAGFEVSENEREPGERSGFCDVNRLGYE